jgi:hypothetical protein
LRTIEECDEVKFVGGQYLLVPWSHGTPEARLKSQEQRVEDWC